MTTTAKLSPDALRALGRARARIRWMDRSLFLEELCSKGVTDPADRRLAEDAFQKARLRGVA